MLQALRQCFLFSFVSPNTEVSMFLTLAVLQVDITSGDVHEGNTCVKVYSIL